MKPKKITPGLIIKAAKVVAISAILISTIGCQETEKEKLIKTATAAKSNISSNFKDPDSVKFKDLRFDWQKKYICGKLNAKNGFGAYTGYGYFRANLVGFGDSATIKNLRLMSQETNDINQKTPNERQKIINEFACIDQSLFDQIKEKNRSPLKDLNTPILVPTN